MQEGRPKQSLVQPYCMPQYDVCSCAYDVISGQFTRAVVAIKKRKHNNNTKGSHTTMPENKSEEQEVLPPKTSK